MFKEAIIYYPKDEKAMLQIRKEIVAFQCTTVIRYIESLNLNSRQIETLFVSLTEDIAEKKQSTFQKLKRSSQTGLSIFTI